MATHRRAGRAGYSGAAAVVNVDGVALPDGLLAVVSKPLLLAQVLEAADADRRCSQYGLCRILGSAGREAFRAAAAQGIVSYGLDAADVARLPSLTAQLQDAVSVPVVPISEPAAAYVIRARAGTLETQLDICRQKATANCKIAVRILGHLSQSDWDALGRFVKAVGTVHLELETIEPPRCDEAAEPRYNLGDSVLSGCTSLLWLKMAGFTHVTELGDDFLAGANNLLHLDLAGLGPVTSVGRSFMAACNQITDGLRMMPLDKMRTVGTAFMMNCIKLEELDMSALAAKDIGDCFMMNCKALKRVDLSRLGDGTTFGVFCISYCDSLQTLDLSGLRRGRVSVGSDFLAGCVQLHDIKLFGQNDEGDEGNDAPADA